MTEEELRQGYDATFLAISFGFETSTIHYVVFSLFFLFDIIEYMVSNLSFILKIPPILGGESARDEPTPIDK